jgi:ribosomal protein L31E
MVERFFTVPLQKSFKTSRFKRANKAVFLLKEFVRKHKRVGFNDIIISREVNEAIWSKGMQGIPRKIEVQLIEEEGKVRVFLKDSRELKKVEKKEKKPLKKEEVKKEEKESKKKDEEIERKKEEKRLKEKFAQAAAFKRKTIKSGFNED